MKVYFKLLCLVVLLGQFPAVQAKLIQVIHTNDIHGYMVNSGQLSDKGGYSVIKTMVDQLRAQAAMNGIPTLFVDAGDFLEGNVLYSADDGAALMKVIDHMGYDAVVIGNHDWQMGTSGLDLLLKNVSPGFPLVGANFLINQGFDHIHKHIKPYVEFNFDGHKIAILGLTTNSPLYAWMVKHGKIASPYTYANKYADVLDKTHDTVIALTHLGQKTDKKVVKKSKNIDLVIGGHSHDALFEPVMVKNTQGRRIPIVQAGSRGNYLGRLLIDSDRNHGVRILQYDLLPVDSRNYGKDHQIDNLVKDSQLALNRKYGLEYLYEVVADTEVPLIRGKKEATQWGDMIADAFRDSTDAQIGLHVPVFAGGDLSPGPITRMDIMEAYPRFFEFEEKYGWSIYEASIRGWILRLALNIMVNTGYPLYFSGVKFEIKKTKLGLYKVKDVQVNGRKLKLFRQYSFVFSEGVARGGLGITTLVKVILRDMKKTPVKIWQAIEYKLKSIGKISADYYESYAKLKGKKKVTDINRTMIPQHKQLD